MTTRPYKIITGNSAAHAETQVNDAYEAGYEFVEMSRADNYITVVMKHRNAKIKV